ncbi:hypothetical protein BCON_0336g00060 [Botryotinia convoluta]|uniref:tyrosinase n=1 Tax=Botryotinia convoluta TaxID=54673 RepID=A0A4Z1HHJ4_9HELO|nr:hypothetical protein BCON_0336g00060 [Botryotinia convoluta]
MGTNTANEDLAQDPTTFRFLNAAILGTSQPDIQHHFTTWPPKSLLTPLSNILMELYTLLLETHMSQLSHSEFDPMFWLHHANVDRHFIIWQAIYSDVWMLPESNLIGTFTIAPGDSDTSASPLTPFYQPDRETPWTSDAARYTSTLGYSYASVPDTIITNATELSANVTANINVLYNLEGVFSDPKRKRDENREWSVAIQALSTALGERSTIRLYTEDSTPVVSFMCCPPPVADGGNPPGLTYHNEFTSVDAVKAVDTSNIDDVVDFLKVNLRWTVNKTDGTVLPTEQVSSLLITVQDEIVTHPAVETELPGRS